MAAQPDPDFPCSLYSSLPRALRSDCTNTITSTIDLPLPTPRLASAALRALSVDKELSPLVRRSFSAIPPPSSDDAAIAKSAEETVMRTEYKATTNRMLRVAVNGFMESLSVVLGVMEELDVGVLGVDGGRE
jgi:EKC/KEOPS complex subunit PCC1/LAGE3